MEYYTRREWGASQSDPPGIAISPVSEIIVHHSFRPHIPESASVRDEKNAMQAMDRFHVNVKEWDDIGYNWVIFNSGRVYEARGWGRSGAHTAGRNQHSVGICFAINGDAHTVSDKAWNSARELISQGRIQGHIMDDYEVSGHCDYSSKSCPGDNVYPSLGENLGKDSAGSRPLLTDSSSGGAVVKVQKRLIELGYDLPQYGADGEYGPETAEAVRRFQRDRDITVDGIVGPETYEELSEDQVDSEDGVPMRPKDQFYDTVPTCYDRLVAIHKHRNVEPGNTEPERQREYAKLVHEVLGKQRIPNASIPEQYHDIRKALKENGGA